MYELPADEDRGSVLKVPADLFLGLSDKVGRDFSYRLSDDECNTTFPGRNLDENP